MHFLVVLVASLISSAQAQANSCVALEKSAKGLKADSDPKSYEVIYAGEPLKVVSKSRDNRHIKVNLGGELYWLRARNMSRLDSSYCAKSTTCVYMGPSSTVHSRPKKDETVRVVDSGLMPVISSHGSWYRIKTTSGFVWMSGSEMRSSRQGCEEPVSRDTILESHAPPSGPKGWLFGMEGGYLPSVSAESLENLLTPVPPAGVDVNDDAYGDPFVDEVVDGRGWYVGATVEFPLFWDFRNKIAVGYKTRSLEYIIRPNPNNTVTPVLTYDQLTPQTESYDFTFIYATTVIKYDGWELLGLEIQPGVLLGVDYSLDEFGITFMTGTQKTVPRFVESAYNEFEFLYGPRLDINFRFITFQAGAIFTTYGLEPSVGLGVQF